MLHKMKLQHMPFEAIREGRKTVELRLYDEKRQGVQVGDDIEFTDLSDPSRKLLTSVVALHRFDSFEEMFRVLPACAMGYREGEIPKTSDMDAYYSPSEQALYGVLGIELTLK